MKDETRVALVIYANDQLKESLIFNVTVESEDLHHVYFFSYEQ